MDLCKDKPVAVVLNDVEQGAYITTLKTQSLQLRDANISSGGSYGCLPLADADALKYWSQHIVSNFAGSSISTPPQGRDYSQWDIPERLKDDLRLNATKAVLGDKTQDLNFQYFRLCWYVGVTFISIFANQPALTGLKGTLSRRTATS